MLPRRIPTKPKRASRWRSMAHCSFVRKFNCCVRDCDDRPIEVAHVRRGSGAGMGQKPDDWNTISLCKWHHAEQHNIGEQSFEKKHGLDMRELADEFAKHSPRRREIEEAKRERNSAP